MENPSRHCDGLSHYRVFLDRLWDGSVRPERWLRIFRKGGSLAPDWWLKVRRNNHLSELTEKDAKLAASMGNDYMVAPDVVIYQDAIEDSEINKNLLVVDSTTSKMAYIRKETGGLPILHASISAKWTMRSDRAQNSRTEALGLIRNRKGHLPHIVVVTGEPMPGRLASLALGTGDIDCMYHFALYELIDAVEKSGAEDSKELLDVLIKGKRLKDISDLPLDLVV